MPSPLRADCSTLYTMSAANASSPSMWRHKLKLKAKLDSTSSQFSVKRCHQVRSIRGQSGVSPRSAWGQPTFSLGSAWVQSGVRRGSVWGHSALPYLDGRVDQRHAQRTATLAPRPCSPRCPRRPGWRGRTRRL